MEWVLLGCAALIVGVAKTSFGGLGSVAVALLALAMPTKESTAAALLLLIVGDIVAVLRYRKAADWSLLRALLPAVVPGLLLGAWFLSAVDDLVLKRAIGWFLLTFVLIQLGWQLTANRRAATADGPPIARRKAPGANRATNTAIRNPTAVRITPSAEMAARSSTAGDPLALSGRSSCCITPLCFW